MIPGGTLGRHALVRALLAAVLVTSISGTAQADPALMDSAFTVTPTIALTSSMRDLVWSMSFNDALPPEVRADAYVAFRSNEEAQIREFLATGYRKATKRANDRDELNDWYIKEINRTAIPGSAVQATSTHAMASSKAAKEDYVQSGYERAQELDRVNDNKYQERLARLTKDDRNYVTFLSTNDPGAQVRAAAQRAIGGDDRTIGLFFKYYWKIGADLDRESFLRTATDRNQVWHDRIRVLTELALAAEKAERESSGEIARKHRQDAQAKWEEIDREAGQSSVDWLKEQDKATAQADAWAQVAEHARAAQSEQDWAAIITQAVATGASWENEAGSLRAQADKWQAIAEQARKAAKDAAERDLGGR